MYNTRPLRNAGGKILKHDLQSKELPSTQIMPHPRWIPVWYELLINDEVGVCKQDSISLTHNLLVILLASDYESLIRMAEILDAFGEKHGASTSTEGDGNGFRDLVYHTMFEKGQSKRIWGELYKVIDSSDIVIHGSLLAVLRQFSRFKSDKQAISVGFVGYPNVCKVAPIPGETKVWQYITLSKRIFLIDCPGAVYQSNDSEADIVLKGVGWDMISYNRVQVHWEDDKDFLAQLCKLTGKPLKGDKSDYTTAAKMILHDWQRGKIPFFVPPPKEEEQALDEVEVDAVADD
ncbi:hypothetical protein SASPL_155805 [Salvia splendens]|uniref:Nuclear GTP-binding protein n=1 Tax=Salvia splendens TaxID=180675 RepID=A0A8X8VXT3_SALSN|nr:hypothetical protein SASPL_155805 [Salvia splendens]